MKWNCPHCGTTLAIEDELLGSTWSFSRCFHCNGFQLVRPQDSNPVRVDDPIASPENIAQVQRWNGDLLSEFASAVPPPPPKLAKIPVPPPAPLLARAPQITETLETPTTPVIEIEAKPEHPMGMAALASLARAREKMLNERARADSARTAIQSVPPPTEKAETQVEITPPPTVTALSKAPAEPIEFEEAMASAIADPHEFPAPLPEVPSRGWWGRKLTKLVPVLIVSLGIGTVASGVYLFRSGAKLMAQAKIPSPPPAMAAPKLAMTIDRMPASAAAPITTPSTAESSLPGHFKILVKNAMLRSGPGTGFGISASGNSGATYLVQEQREGWFRLAVPQPAGNVISAWVRGDLGELVR